MYDPSTGPHVESSDKVFPPWIRYRFEVPHEDPRPVKFPPPGPYWISGESGNGNSVLIAYLPKDVDLKEWWPDSKHVMYTRKQDITYTDRFQKPDWYE